MKEMFFLLLVLITGSSCDMDVNVVYDITPPDHYSLDDINAQLPRGDVTLLRDLGIDDIEDLTVAEKVARYVIQSPEMFSPADTQDLMAVSSALHKKLLIVWESGEEFLPIATMNLPPGRDQAFSDAVRSIHSVMSDALLQWRLMVRSYFVVEERDDGSKVLHRYARQKSGDAKYHTAKMQHLGSKTELELLRKKAEKTVAKTPVEQNRLRTQRHLYSPAVVESPPHDSTYPPPQDYRSVTYVVGGALCAVVYAVIRIVTCYIVK